MLRPDFIRGGRPLAINNLGQAVYNEEMEKVGESHKRIIVQNEVGLLNLIEQHRNAVLTTPFILAAVLMILYAFAGNEFRQVLDFMSPSHLLGR